MKPAPLTQAGYAALARRIVALAARVQATAGAQTVRERQARTRAINLLAQHVKRLQLRNAGLLAGADQQCAQPFLPDVQR